MGFATQLAFPGALLGSAFVAIFALLVTAGISPPPVASAASPLIGAVQPTSVNEALPTSEPAAPAGPQTEQAGETEAESAELSVTEAPQEGEETGVAAESAPAEEPQESEDKCKVSQRYPEKILQWCNLISKLSKKNGLDPDLIAALIWQESGGNPVAYSKSGAVGLMQVMPRDGIAASFMCINGPCFTNRPTIAELQDPAFNVQYGTGMLANLVAKYGDVREALRYYGPMDVGYYYADKVLGIYENYRK
jgi:soluble lytic murein transglycosylase-like protein